jgi:hypothetical protein
LFRYGPTDEAQEFLAAVVPESDAVPQWLSQSVLR